MKSILEISDAPKSVINLIIRNNIKSMVEIGVFRSSFCRQILKTVSDRLDCYWLVDPWSKEFCIDGSGSDYTQSQWDDEYVNACRLMHNYDCVKVLRMTSQKAARLFEHKSVDLVYVDGSHKPEDILLDFKSWVPKISKGGIIAGHDYSSGWPDVVKAVDSQFNRIQLHRGTVWSVRIHN
jgi:hypothetical protein